MGQSTDARLTSEVAQQICERTASVVVLEGSIASLGSRFLLGLRARHCRTGNIVAQEQVQVAHERRGAELSQPGRAQIQNPAGRIARYGGTAFHAARRGDDNVTRGPQGLQHRYESELILRECRSPYFFTCAPSQSIPGSRSRTPGWGLRPQHIGESVLSAESTTKAWQLRDRVSDRERFFIDFTYDRQVTGNLEKAYQTLELWLQTYLRGPYRMRGVY